MALKLNINDLEFILRQIKIAEANSTAHAGTGAVGLTQVYVDAFGNVVPAGTPGAIQAISDPHLPFGLRTVDGTFNNLVPGRETWGSAGPAMPRMLDPNFINDADGDTFFGITNGDYSGTSGANIVDADPRTISNLIVDMTVDNPAAITAWFANPIGVSMWQDAHPGMVAVAPDDPRAGTGNFVALTNADLAMIPNIAPDVGLSKPFNAWMTFFGQFFDHGLDLISKGGNGTVFIPLQPDDPLILVGPDGIAGTGDEVTNPARQFMALTRSTPVNGPGPDGILGNGDDTTHEGRNTTTPFVDQNQTYTSHASHQVFLREYALDTGGRPVATGLLLNGTTGGLPTWGDVKAQALNMLGIQLSDQDVLNVPLLRTDAYGEFIRDPVTGFAQVIVGIGADGIPNTDDDLTVSGTPGAPVVLSTLNGGLGPVRVDHAFLDDIAHFANPGGKVEDGDNVINDANGDGVINGSEVPLAAGTYDDELLARHFITGDGRGNENIGLTTVHHIFHSEHNRQVADQQREILADAVATGDATFLNEWLLVDIPLGGPIPTDPAQLTWDGERLFQAARVATEMQYQHLVFEEFARKINPNIDPFVFNAVTDINPAIFAEFANTVYRFGHSMLTDSMPRLFADGSTDDVGLIQAFLDPLLFDNDQTISADEGAAAIVRAMTNVQGNEIDEFVVSSLRNNLVGLPLDLAALNIARGRDTGIPSLNDARQQLYAATSSSWLKPYTSWVEVAANLKTPMSVINFIAAYGLHPLIAAETTIAGKRAVAEAIVFGSSTTVAVPTDRVDFLNGTGTWAGLETGFNDIDLWIGGLAEKILPFGGMLGPTFSAIFEAQLEALQFGDRFYYLSRTQGLNFLNQLENNNFAKLIMANTDITQPGADGIRGTDDDVITHHIGPDAFAKYDFSLEVNIAQQLDPDPVGNDPVLEALGLGKVQRDDPSTPGADTNYLRFTGGEHVLVGGTDQNDRIITSDGDDGIWGGAGDDDIESGFGVDLVDGGAGDDVITDAGDTGDFLKGEDGNDVLATSNGLDILMGGAGKDAIFLGIDASEVFGGSGDDFIVGSPGADVLLGNEGDDWIEGGAGFDGISGDNSQLFFNSDIKGHDVMFAGSEEQDFDAESGDDIMVQGESVIRNEGMFGFDWSTFQGFKTDGYADLRIKIFTTVAQDILRNRFDKVEALSGWTGNDTLIGDSRVAGGVAPPGAPPAEGVFENDGLDQAGIDRIAGLSDLVTIAAGQQFWEEGNILLGGSGSDILQGNGANDILDGDRYLNVRISIRDTGGNEIATVDTMKHVFPANAVGLPAGWAGKSLFELLVSRAVKPDQLNIVREILTAAPGTDNDVAVFNDVRANYTITPLGGGVVRVEHTGFGNDPLVLIDDGTDTLHNIETLRFLDGDFVIGGATNISATGAPVISDTTPLDGQTLSLDFSSIQDPNGLGPFSIQWQSSPDGTTWADIAGANGASFTPIDAPNGQLGSHTGLMLRAVVSFTDGLGNAETVTSLATAPVGWNWTAGGNVASTFNGLGGNDVAVGGGGADTLNGNAGADDLRGNGGDDRLFGGTGNDTLLAGAGNDRLFGGDDNDFLFGAAGVDRLFGGLGNDAINGGLGNDIVDAGDGDDIITWDFSGLTAGGRDIIDGNLGNDTVQINGNATAETFRIYTRAEATAAGITGLAGGTEIVVTRNGTNNASVIAELDNVEELIMNALTVSSPGGQGGGTSAGDTVIVIGDFTQTSLNFNTITVNGTAGADSVNITGLSSAHRIVFNTNGGSDSFVGDVRDQDVINLTGGSTFSEQGGSPLGGLAPGDRVDVDAGHKAAIAIKAHAPEFVMTIAKSLQMTEKNPATHALHFDKHDGEDHDQRRHHDYNERHGDFNF